MGVPSSIPSYSFDQVYLPADCFRLCTPESCFCRGGHQGRNKYVYVDQRNSRNNRESYRDPMELIERGMVPPSYWRMANVDRWRAKDYEVMSHVLAQVLAERRGITDVPWAEMMNGVGGGMNMGMNGMGGINGMQGFGPTANAGWGPWQQAPWINGNAGQGMGKKDFVDINETRERVQLHDDIMFGSEAERREKQVEEQLLKRFQPMIPELAKLIALQQAGLAGGAAPAAGMAPGMPGGQMGMNGVNPFAAAGGMQMMNPYAGMMGGMNPMMMGGDPGMMGGGGEMGGRRRPRGRRGRDFDFDDDDDDDFGFGRGRGGRRRRRGRFNGLFDDDDFGGDGSRSPRRPPKGPQRPKPGGNSGGGGGGGGIGGGSAGGGGAVFDTLNDEARFRSVPAGVPQPAHWASPPRATEPRPPPMASTTPNRVLTPVLVGSDPPVPTRTPVGGTRAWSPPSIPPTAGDRAPPYRSFPGTFDLPGPPAYSGTPVEQVAPTRPVTERHVDFHPEAGLARPRSDEENRGEPQAGGPTGPHDIEPS